MVGYVKGTEEPTEGIPSDQSWNNLNKKLSRIGL